MRFVNLDSPDCLRHEYLLTSSQVCEYISPRAISGDSRSSQSPSKRYESIQNLKQLRLLNRAFAAAAARALFKEIDVCNLTVSVSSRSRIIPLSESRLARYVQRVTISRRASSAAPMQIQETAQENISASFIVLRPGDDHRNARTTEPQLIQQ